MTVTFVLKYIGYNIFSLERYRGSVYIPDKYGTRLRKKDTSTYVYEDGITLNLQVVDEGDEYLHLFITVAGASSPDSKEQVTVTLRVEADYPLVVSFICIPGFADSTATEGGYADELVAGDRYLFAYSGGEYVRES